MDKRTVLLCLEDEIETDLVQTLQAHQSFAVARRCADLIEVVAVATAGLGSIAILEDTSELSRALVAELRSLDLDVVVLSESDRANQLTEMGVSLVITNQDAGSVITGLEGLNDLHSLGNLTDIETDSSSDREAAGIESLTDLLEAEDVNGAIGEESRETASRSRFPTRRQIRTETDDTAYTSSSNDRHEKVESAVVSGLDSSGAGRIIVVRGTQGSPGRSVIALQMGIELGRSGNKVVIVDADLCAPSLALAAGARPEWAGIAVACKMASRGRLNVENLSQLLHSTGPDSSLLSGLSRAERWREVHPEDLVAVLNEARKLADYVIVDTAAWMPDESNEFDVTPTRERVSARILSEADQVVTVATGNLIGMSRLIALLEDSSYKNEIVVVNRVSSTSSGPAADTQIRSIIEPVAKDRPLLLIWEDEAVPTALLRGVSLSKVRKSDRILASLHDLIKLLDGSSLEHMTFKSGWAFWRRRG